MCARRAPVPAAEARFVRWRMGRNRKTLVLVMLGLPACVPGVFTPRLSSAPLAPNDTVVGAGYRAIWQYFRQSSMAEGIDSNQVVFAGVSARDLPAALPVTSRPDTLEGPHVLLEPGPLQLSSDSLAASVFLAAGWAPRWGQSGTMELRRRAGCRWTIWRWSPGGFRS